MPKYEVIIEVDGTTHREEVSGPDCKLAMNKALKLHPVKVLSITPLEEQLDFDRDHHPGQITADELAEHEEEILGAPVRSATGEAIADLGQRIADEFGLAGVTPEQAADDDDRDPISSDDNANEAAAPVKIDPDALERELAAMRGPDGTDESGLDS